MGEDIDGPDHLAPGDVDPDGMFSRYGAWRRLLDAIGRLYPHVMHELRAIPCSERDFPEAGFNEQLLEPILLWAEKHRIRSEYTVRTALFTMRAWALDKAAPLQWTFPRQFPAGSGSGFEPILPDPTIEQMDDWLERARRLYQQRVQELLAISDSDGLTFQRARRKNAPGADHFEWLAHHLVGHRNKSQIAELTYRTRETVADGLRELQRLMGHRVPGRRGRPPSRK